MRRPHISASKLTELKEASGFFSDSAKLRHSFLPYEVRSLVKEVEALQKEVKSLTLEIKKYQEEE